MSRLRGISRVQWAIAAGVIFVVLAVGTAVATGVGKDEPADDSVAVVDGEQISEEDFNRALDQAAKRQGLEEVPAPGDEQYEPLRDEALNDVLDTAWILGEADERGVQASDREVQQEFERTKEENFETEKEYQDFLEESGFTQEDIDQRVRLQVLSTKIQDQITEDAGDVPEGQARDFYEANEEQFVQPASRNVRIVVNEDAEKAQRAANQLSEDNSPESWNRVAQNLSTDAATKDNGGLREGVTEGTFGSELDEQIFNAEQGEVVGPVETEQGQYVFQVDTVTEAQTVPFEEAREQIDQQLSGQLQQQAFSAFLSDYRDRWIERTICADDFLIDRCDNFEGGQQPCPDPSLPEEQQQQQLEATGCPPPVVSATPAAPGTVNPFVPAQSAPQRPHPAGEDAPAGEGGEALPGGLPGGQPGQPGQPGAPQQAPPGS